MPTYPRRRAVVRLTHYEDGNVLRGDQANPNLTFVGMVTESPAEGSSYFTVAPDTQGQRAISTFANGLQKDYETWQDADDLTVGRREDGYAIFYDRANSERWSVSTQRVSLARSVLDTSWTFEAVEPAPPERIEVGDLVRYVPQVERLDRTDWAESIWQERTERDSIVVRGPRKDRDDYLVLRSVFSPDEDPLPSLRDDWQAPAERLRLVAKATYRRIG